MSRWSGFLLLLLFTSCKPAAQEENRQVAQAVDEFAAAKLDDDATAESIKQKLVALNEAINPGAAKPLGRPKVVSFVKLTRALTQTFPKDIEVPKYLCTSAEFTRSIGEMDLAVGFYGQVYKDYPDHSLAPVALFIQGFMLENELDEKEQAKANYERFLQQYPDHEFAATAKLSLERFGMSTEELIKSFRKKNKQ